MGTVGHNGRPRLPTVSNTCREILLGELASLRRVGLHSGVGITVSWHHCS